MNRYRCTGPNWTGYVAGAVVRIDPARLSHAQLERHAADLRRGALVYLGAA